MSYSMSMWEAIVLGLVQGATEFLPISSTGHLVLFRDLLAVSDVNALAIDAVLHLATLAAVVLYFRVDLWRLVQTGLRKLGRLPVNEQDARLLYALLLGTIPAVVVGVGLESYVAEHFQTAPVVAGVLFGAALFFIYAEWYTYQHPPHGGVTVRRGLLVGCFQALALIPGFSRSGATIAGGMLLGLTRYEASRFSFLLAIPITLGIGLKHLLDLIVADGTVAWGAIAVAAAVAFVVALLVIHYFLAFIRRHTLWPFIWYSVILSLLIGYATVFVWPA